MKTVKRTDGQIDKRFKNFWTPKQDEFLKKNFIKMTRKEMALKLNRTLDSVNKRLDRYLKLKKDECIRKNMLGKNFGILIVMECLGTIKGQTRFKCKCQCGNEKITSYNVLAYGNITSCGCLRRKNLEKTQYKSMFNMYIYSARKRNIEFNLDFPLFLSIIKENCHYCNRSPAVKPLNAQYKKNKISENRAIRVNGIDRKNNNEGYEKDNCVPCCSICNFMKQNMGYEEFLSAISCIYNNIIVNKVY